MKIILALIRKEFIQIFRDKLIMPIIFVVPLVQLIILANAATLEMKNIKMMVVDNDLSITSRKLISKFEGSPFFIINKRSTSIDIAEKELKKGNVDVIVNIPQNFEKDLYREKKDKILVLINAINGVVAGISSAYIQNIILDYNIDVISSVMKVSRNSLINNQLNITYTHWYNPQLNYKNYMVPGILVILVTIIGMFLSCLNLVKEKEIGTIEQINVTPIKKYQFISGKLIPFLILALFELCFGLFIGKLLFNIPILGNIGLLLIFTAVYLIIVLGMGLIVATSVQTQQQAMFVLFFVMIVGVMMSGIFTSVETMPIWAQKINLLNPIFYYMKIIRMILLKGSSLIDLYKELIIMSVFAILSIQTAVLTYRKKVA